MLIESSVGSKLWPQSPQKPRGSLTGTRNRLGPLGLYRIQGLLLALSCTILFCRWVVSMAQAGQGGRGAGEWGVEGIRPISRTASWDRPCQVPVLGRALPLKVRSTHVPSCK